MLLCKDLPVLDGRMGNGFSTFMAGCIDEDYIFMSSVACVSLISTSEIASLWRRTWSLFAHRMSYLYQHILIVMVHKGDSGSGTKTVDLD